ncbi:hypothetical protein FTO70_05870 [Methanosarcina sp. KYL-1]|uniref:4'-phosphopantetheinyl transferase family protein n=1 Tax=Methanosarcina sp. KYL-1 TaxID=2602068 RepID=UPI00210120A0|nr:hypothetical protein [Methanosarcina sp. KYL-1]MCQ1535222.1 hypothetical protein [Methanosarcina sp. KYL-1]
MQTKIKIPSTTSLEHVPHLWEQNDVLIFLIDLDSYNTLSTEHLDGIEKEYLERLQTRHFKKRYTASRLVLKCILCRLLNERSVSDIVTYKDEYGKVHVRGHEELHICISYTGNIVALAISKVEVGVDMELKRMLSLSNISKYLYTKPLDADKSGSNLDLLTTWTLKEAYCKFSNKSIFSNFNKEMDFSNVCSSSYIINNIYILAIITDSNRYTLKICRLQKISFL